MINVLFSRKIKRPLLTFFLLILIPLSIFSQEEQEEENDLSRTFMPNFQMGYVFHGTEELSGGLMTQLSMEYRDISNFVFRINYDDFNANMNITYPVNEEVTFTGKTSFSDLIVGIGYRETILKNNFTAYIQPGMRFYGYPVFESDGNEIKLDYDSRNVGVIRYSIGYEYTINAKLFLIVEGLAIHTLRSKDFWADNIWSYGITAGISASLL